MCNIRRERNYILLIKTKITKLHTLISNKVYYLLKIKEGERVCVREVRGESKVGIIDFYYCLFIALLNSSFLLCYFTSKHLHPENCSF